MTKVQYDELIAFHPGYYIKEIIDDMGVTQEEFARRLGTTGKTLSDLLKGKISLSHKIALNLSIMLGTSVNIWLNIQKTYTEKVLEIERRKGRDKEIATVASIDYKYFTDLGVVPKAKKAADKADELLKYFKISSFDVFKEPDFLVNYRTAVGSVNVNNTLNSNAWVQTALNMGQSMDAGTIDLKRLKGHLPEIRRMTLQAPAEFLPQLSETLRSCGIAFVLLPHLKNSGVNGAVKWVNKEKVILAMNDRRKYADVFWFSLFHEIKHVFQKKLALLIIDGTVDDPGDVHKELEIEADAFARDFLLPEDTFSEFVAENNYSNVSILWYANEMEIHPGIVVGRLQNEGLIGFDKLNGLRDKFTVE